MDPYIVIAILITLSALFAYINLLYLKMPMSVGLMFLSLLLSLGLLFLSPFGPHTSVFARKVISGMDFSHLLLNGMLGLLLFAGALHVNLNDLLEEKLEIAVYATVGVVMSTVLVGSTIYGLSNWMGWGLRPVDAFLFGALISPTDPIAVLAILKSAGAPKRLETRIAGESLFNDGIGVVVFLVLLEIATGEAQLDAGTVGVLFLKEAGGGVVFGLISGFLVYKMLRRINHYQVEVMLTLALVIGGYNLAGYLHLSAPLAMVVAGLLIGNRGRRLAMSRDTRQHLDTFWKLIDEILNALLFVLIGLEVLVVTVNWPYIMAGILAVPVALAARFTSIGGPFLILKRWKNYPPRSVSIMTWGGLRGGISVALALSIPAGHHRELILAMTYAVVVFSVLVQGLTIRRLVGTTEE